MPSKTDQAFTLDIDAIVSFADAGSERVLNGPMRYFKFDNTSSTRAAYVSWSGNDDHIIVPPGKTVIVNGRSQVEKFYLRSAGPAAAPMYMHVSCTSHAPFGSY